MTEKEKNQKIMKKTPEELRNMLSPSDRALADAEMNKYYTQKDREIDAEFNKLSPEGKDNVIRSITQKQLYMTPAMKDYKTKMDKPVSKFVPAKKATPISSTIPEKPEKTDIQSMTSATIIHDTIDKTLPNIPEKVTPDKTKDMLHRERTVVLEDERGRAIQTVREITKEPTPEEKARRDVEAKLETQRHLEAQRESIKRKLEKEERIKKGIPEQMETVEINFTPQFEMQIEGERYILKLCEELAPSKRGEQLHKEKYWRWRQMDGGIVSFGDVVIDPETKLPKALTKGLDPGHSKLWPLTVNVSGIPDYLLTLIRNEDAKKLEARNQELEQTLIKSKNFTESSEKEVKDLKKENLKRKLAMVKSQKHVTENYLPHLPKKRRWNPFSH